MPLGCRWHRLAGVVAAMVIAGGCASATQRAAAAAGTARLGAGVGSGPASPAAVEPGYRPNTTAPAVIAHGPADARRIALTFDSNMTEAMLHRLDTGQVGSYANTAV